MYLQIKLKIYTAAKIMMTALIFQMQTNKPKIQQFLFFPFSPGIVRFWHAPIDQTFCIFAVWAFCAFCPGRFRKTPPAPPAVARVFANWSQPLLMIRILADRQTKRAAIFFMLLAKKRIKPVAFYPHVVICNTGYNLSTVCQLLTVQ
jgi:hypothetical protein